MTLVLVGGGVRARPLAVAAALGTGVLIATYTIVDALAVVRAPVLAYTGWIFLLQGPALPLVALVRRGSSLPALLRRQALPGMFGGVVSFAAYTIVLWAQTSGALAAVAALRETSIVVGALIGAAFLGEGLGTRRAVAAAIVLIGIFLLAVQ